MPVYTYKCRNCDHTIEIRQTSYDAPKWKKCSECGKRADKVIHPPNMKFVGSGFYVNDYG